MDKQPPFDRLNNPIDQVVCDQIFRKIAEFERGEPIGELEHHKGRELDEFDALIMANNINSGIWEQNNSQAMARLSTAHAEGYEDMLGMRFAEQQARTQWNITRLGRFVMSKIKR